MGDQNKHVFRAKVAGRELLLQDQTLDLPGRDHLRAPAEPLPIGVAGMGADDDGTIS